MNSSLNWGSPRFVVVGGRFRPSLSIAPRLRVVWKSPSRLMFGVIRCPFAIRRMLWLMMMLMVMMVASTPRWHGPVVVGQVGVGWLGMMLLWFPLVGLVPVVIRSPYFVTVFLVPMTHTG